jgi:GMP synthase (glutamine-hydrolysing)
MKDAILLLDFGSQYTHLIKSSLGRLGFNCIVEAADFTPTLLKTKYGKILTLKGIILSGGAQSVKSKNIPFDKKWIASGLPILGICYGHQLLADLFGGEVKKVSKEFAAEKIKVLRQSPLLRNIPNTNIVWMSHQETIVHLPDNFKAMAMTKNSLYAGIEDPERKLYGIQFHPEVSHTKNGQVILQNFCQAICRMTPESPWNAKDWTAEARRRIHAAVGNKRILIGVSGGVDSMTTAMLLRSTLPAKQLLAVYMDSGLMPDETEQEVRNVCESNDIPLLIHRASKLFFKDLRGITKPSEKGRIIGRTFIREFEKVARRNNAQFFAQGTIWSDVVESGVTKFSSQIKPHHNVSGLPSKMSFTLLEPLRELFKDQVRETANYLGLPAETVQKRVFPGPGFAIRVEGEVTREKVALVKKCTKIIEDVLYVSPFGQKIWMAFAILICVPSLGVKGDQKIHNTYAIVLRVVESKNSLTANFSHIPYTLIDKISSRITNETEIGRVVYDITNKPPATIEWQ